MVVAAMVVVVVVVVLMVVLMVVVVVCEVSTNRRAPSSRLPMARSTRPDPSVQ